MRNKILKPVILITVYRRYGELLKTLEKIPLLPEHLGGNSPDVVVIWADPVIGHLWFFQNLIDQGKIKHLITRDRIPDGDGCSATSYPESRNIRKGLEFIKREYGDDYYVIVQAADVNAPPGSYGLIHNQINLDEFDVFAFRWNNPCTLYAWHTNMFGVTMNEDGWPPLAHKIEQSTLEHKWGTELRDKNIQMVKWQNDNNRWFSHGYDVNNEIEIKPQSFEAGLNLYISGQHKYRFVRWLKSLFGVFSLRKHRE